MTETDERQPDNGAVPYKILPKTLAGKDFVFIIVRDDFLGFPEQVRQDAIDDFGADCKREGLHGNVILVWPCLDGNVGYYPEDFSEVRDFLRGIKYKEFEKLFLQTIRSAR
jgi:hypothetical protein